MHLSKIEKCARLMQLSYKVIGDRVWLQYDTSKREYNPLTSKSDLVDLMCAVSNIGVIMNYSLCIVTADKEDGSGHEHESVIDYAAHPDKQTALAHAVVDVACQIYDRQFGDKE